MYICKYCGEELLEDGEQCYYCFYNHRGCIDQEEIKDIIKKWSNLGHEEILNDLKSLLPKEYK